MYKEVYSTDGIITQEATTRKIYTGIVTATVKCILRNMNVSLAYGQCPVAGFSKVGPSNS
jgi:hypothetical protein